MPNESQKCDKPVNFDRYPLGSIPPLCTTPGSILQGSRELIPEVGNPNNHRLPVSINFRCVKNALFQGQKLEKLPELKKSQPKSFGKPPKKKNKKKKHWKISRTAWFTSVLFSPLGSIYHHHFFLLGDLQGYHHWMRLKNCLKNQVVFA